MTSPLYRQAGGKRALTPALLTRFPKTFDTYVEPFLGGGALFFAAQEAGRLAGKLVLLGDADRALIALLIEARTAPARLHRKLVALGEEMTASGDAAGYYRTIRQLWNLGDRRAAYTLFLRCCAFNGLWRLNKAGEVNTAWNKENPPRLPTCDRIEAVGVALANAEILAWDFRCWEPAVDDLTPADEAEAVRAAHAAGDGSTWIGPGAVIYLDPPFLDGWTGYQPGGFTAQDQVDVVRRAALWARRGARVLYSQAETPEAHQLLAEHWPEATRSQHMMRRAINSDGDGRGPVAELLAVGGGS